MTFQLRRDIVVVGASAGGVSALNAFLAKLPPDLPASVLVVLHLSKTAHSALPRVLNRAGPLHADLAEDGEALETGRVYAARPDRHLLLVRGDAGDEVRLSGSPSRNGHRPAIDALFLSAARYGGTRVLSVVLSGALDDGSWGSAVAEKRGGLVTVQDPDDATYPDMPRNASLAAPGAIALPAGDLAEMVTRRAGEPVEPGSEPPSDDLVDSVDALLTTARVPSPPSAGTPAAMSCPSCDGPLYEVDDGQGKGLAKYDCLIGHSWSPEALFAHQSRVRERALRYAVRTLHERVALSQRMAGSARKRGNDRTARRFESTAEEASRAIEVLGDVLDRQLASEPGPFGDHPGAG